MKKYLLAVLALGATMMVACNPDDNKGGNEPEPEVKADYTLSTNVMSGFLDLYGDDYEIGLNDCVLELGAVYLDAEGNPVSLGVIFFEYLSDLDNTTGLGSFTPSGPNWITGENLQPNTYFSGVEVEGEPESSLVGSAYMEMDLATEALTVAEGIVDGTLTISMSGDNYVVKGIFKTGNNKVVKVDYTGALEVTDESEEGGAAPLSVKKSVRIGKSFSSVSKFLKK